MDKHYVKVDLWTRPLDRTRYSKDEIKRKQISYESGSGILTHAIHVSLKLRSIYDPSPLHSENTIDDTADEIMEMPDIPSDVFENAMATASDDDVQINDLGSGILSTQIPEEVRETSTRDEIRAKLFDDDTSGEQTHNAMNAEAQDIPEADDSKEKKKPKKKSIKVRLDNLLYDYSELELEAKEEAVNELINKDHFYDEVLPIDDNLDDSSDSGIKINKPIIIVVGLLFACIAALVYVIQM